MNQISYKWDSKKKDMDETPAHLRRGVNLENIEDSSKNNVSKYTLDSYEINGEVKPEIKKNNKFLSDQPD